MTSNRTQDRRRRIVSLRLRLHVQGAELLGCTTKAMRKCVLAAIADTERQIANVRVQQ